MKPNIVQSKLEAAQAFDALSPDDQSKFWTLVDAGTDKLHAINLVRSQRLQDAARTSVEADDLTREPSRAEKIGAAGMGAADAATFGLADEIRGALGILPGVAEGKSVGDAYRSSRDDARAYSEGPLAGSFGTGQLLGQAAQAGLGVGAGAAKLGTGLAGNAAEQGIKLGAGTGALGGFGANAKSIGDTLKNTLFGAASGAALGAAPGALGEAISGSETAPSIGKATSPLDKLAADVKDLSPTARAALKHLLPGGKRMVSFSDEVLADAGLAPTKPPSPYGDIPFTPATSSSSATAPPVDVPPSFSGAANDIGLGGQGGKDVEPPSFTKEAEAFDPGGADWRRWALQEAAAPTARPDLEPAAAAYRTPTKADRTPLPKTPATPATADFTSALDEVAAAEPRSMKQELATAKWRNRGSPESAPKPSARDRAAAPFKDAPAAQVKDPIAALKAAKGDVIAIREVMTEMQSAGWNNVQIQQAMQLAGVQ